MGRALTLRSLAPEDAEANLKPGFQGYGTAGSREISARRHAWCESEQSLPLASRRIQAVISLIGMMGMSRSAHGQCPV